MNKLHFTFFLCLISCISIAKAQTIWTGPPTTFTKSDSADWTLEANQDRITDNVWITRADKQSLFNIKTETKYTAFSSPADTEWAFGTTANKDTMTFQNLQAANNGSPASMIGMDMVLHLISEDIYIDIKFISFSGGNTGGGFSYTRSTNQMSSLETQSVAHSARVFPNPASDYFNFSGFINNEPISIINAQGIQMYEGRISNDVKLDIRNWAPGLYVVSQRSGIRLKLLKL